MARRVPAVYGRPPGLFKDLDARIRVKLTQHPALPQSGTTT